MLNHPADVKTRVSVLVLLAFAGCQRATNPAIGPFSPTGNVNPVSSPTLIPFGNFNEATRVPPPSTGSSQVSNGYSALAPNSPVAYAAGGDAVNPPAGTWFASDSGGNPVQPPMNSVATNVPNEPPRVLLGGMPVNDLTVAMRDSRMLPNDYVGSGATNPTAHSQDWAAIPPPGVSLPAAAWQTVQPAGGFRPIDEAAFQLQPTSANIPAPVGSPAPTGPAVSTSSAGYGDQPAQSGWGTVPTTAPVQPMTAAASTAGNRQQYQPVPNHAPAPPSGAFQNDPNQQQPGQFQSAQFQSVPPSGARQPAQLPVTNSPTADQSLLWRKPAVAR